MLYCYHIDRRVEMVIKQLQQPQHSPEPKPQVKFCTEFAAPISAHLSLATESMSTDHLGISTQNQMWDFCCGLNGTVGSR